METISFYGNQSAYPIGTNNNNKKKKQYYSHPPPVKLNNKKIPIWSNVNFVCFRCIKQYKTAKKI